MRPSIVGLIAFTCLVLGYLIGATADPRADRSARPVDAAPESSANRDRGAPASAWSGGSDDREPSSPRSRRVRDLERRAYVQDERRREGASRERHDATRDAEDTTHANGDPGQAASDPPERRLARLQEEVESLRAERTELLGEAIATPANVEPRFGGPALSSSVQRALEQIGVPGAVEATDCSEHPCITFGRLAGDEEDMEEIERSAALSEYKSDVLTLLFWATTATPDELVHSPETGLFALAFYTFEDRAELGEALDRRIRARVMEYWNADRPERSRDP